MFKNLGIKDILQLFLIVTTVLIVMILYADNQLRNRLWQSAYPVRASMSLSNLTCSDNSPEWMRSIIQYQTQNNAPTNQIAYINSQGHTFHCESGYIKKYPIISEEVSEDSRFRFASITKLWTSDAVLSFIKDKKIDFETPLASVLTEINNPVDSRINDITIGQLLSHRAGFDRLSIYGNDMFGIGKEICPNHLSKLNEISLNFTPNDKVSYSNLGYCLLGEVVSRLADKPYVEYINDEYKLDNSNIQFIANNPLPDEVFYNHVETGLIGVSNIYTEFNYQDLAAVAGLSGNAVALAQQVKWMIDKPKPNITSMNNQHQCDLSKLKDCYGYAMYPYQKSLQDKKVYFRSGKLRGLSSLVMVGDDGSVVALLSNGVSNNGIVDIHDRLYDTF